MQYCANKKLFTEASDSQKNQKVLKEDKSVTTLSLDYVMMKVTYINRHAPACEISAL